ncbi:hypothetical protein [Paenibacillus lactis]|uniref:hypothetical protein n=1 Tax=Paenibacillus lactis TaxID=228574 RepID=UPI003D76365E
MSDQLTDNLPLTETEDKDEARFLRVDKVKFRGCNLTEGKLYEIKRYYTAQGFFSNGEMYVIDDIGKENYSALMLCKTTLYK